MNISNYNAYFDDDNREILPYAQYYRRFFLKNTMEENYLYERVSRKHYDRIDLQAFLSENQALCIEYTCIKRNHATIYPRVRLIMPLYMSSNPYPRVTGGPDGLYRLYMSKHDYVPMTGDFPNQLINFQTV